MGCYEAYVTREGVKRCNDEHLCPDCEICQLRADLAALEQACKEALPGVYYMDPPDGGDVPLGEQVLRMGEDAARYRKWRYGATARCVATAKALCCAGTPEEIDEAIDALAWQV